MVREIFIILEVQRARRAITRFLLQIYLCLSLTRRHNTTSRDARAIQISLFWYLIIKLSNMLSATHSSTVHLASTTSWSFFTECVKLTLLYSSIVKFCKVPGTKFSSEDALNCHNLGSLSLHLAKKLTLSCSSLRPVHGTTNTWVPLAMPCSAVNLGSQDAILLLDWHNNDM